VGRSDGWALRPPVYEQFEGYLNDLRAPAMYAPGDDGWIDRDRPAAGGFDSEERLAYIRANSE
jgi:hypothetical protein